MKLVLYPNELIIKAGNSKIFQSNRQIQGKLIVTNQRIYFRVLEERFSDFNKEILPTEISDLVFFSTKWLMPYGMLIIARNGTEHRFIVRNRNTWASIITKMY